MTRWRVFVDWKMFEVESMVLVFSFFAPEAEP